MSDSRADANLAKPVAKNLPGGYAPAPIPEIHQQVIEPGYSNSPGPEGDGGGEEWPQADIRPKWTSDNSPTGNVAEKNNETSEVGEPGSTTTSPDEDKAAAESTQGGDRKASARSTASKATNSSK